MEKLKKIISLIVCIFLISGCSWFGNSNGVDEGSKEEPTVPKIEDVVPEQVVGKKEILTVVEKPEASVFSYNFYDTDYNTVISVQRIEQKGKKEPIFVIVLAVGHEENFYAPLGMWDERGSIYDVAMLHAEDNRFPNGKKIISGVGVIFKNQIELSMVNLPSNKFFVEFGELGTYQFTMTYTQWNAALRTVFKKEGF